MDRFEICHVRRNWRSCKICASCVIFFQKTNHFQVLDLHSTNVIYTETVEILHIHFNSNKKIFKLPILIHLRCFIVSKIVAIYALLMYEIYGPKI